MRTKLLIPTVLFAALFNPSFVEAQEDADLMGYDSIVRELSNGSSRYEAPSQSAGDPFTEVRFHGGLAYTSSYIIVEPEAGSAINGVLKGVEFNLGIDLLSRFWMAEGAIRSYQPEDLNSDTQVSLREFDLRLVYHEELSRNLRYRLGSGLSSRYLQFKSRNATEVIKDRYTTPSLVVFLGAQVDLSDKISIGPDISYRSALIDETVDRKSFDANLKLNAHF